MPAKKKHFDSPALDDFESLVDSIVQIHHQAQDFATKAVNVGLTLRNWLIGHRIVEFEQNGKDRAAYGERLLPELAKRLASAGLKRVDMRELRRFRLLYTTYPQIRETVTPELLARAGALALQPLLQFTQQKNRETLSPDSQILELPAQPTPLASHDLIHRISFSHLSELLEVSDDTQRRFYEIECIRGNWSVRELRRQIDSLYYQRSGLSKNKTKLSQLAHAGAETHHPKIHNLKSTIFKKSGGRCAASAVVSAPSIRLKGRGGSPSGPKIQAQRAVNPKSKIQHPKSALLLRNYEAALNP
jgi:hypothetical protein